MKRIEFLKLIEENVRGIYRTSNYESSRFGFEMMISEKDFEKDYKDQLSFLFENINDKMPVKSLDFYKHEIFKREIDHDYLEEIEGDKDTYKYFVSFDAHKLYDFFAENNVFKLKKENIYRIEQKNGGGLYDGIGLALLKNYDTQESPSDDPNLNHIFNKNSNVSSNQYHKEWQFGFKDKKSAMDWIHDDSLLERLDKSGLKIVKYESNEAYIVHGNQQSIFMKKKSKKIEESSLLELKATLSTKNIKSSFKPNI